MQLLLSSGGGVATFVQWDRKLYNNGVTVDPSDALLGELKSVLGEDNVKLITK